MPSYSNTVQYLESFINYEKIPEYPYKDSLKINRIQEFLAKIGNPQRHLKCVHIAGTKGKGSTCAFIAYILREAGFKVGLYTSPHLTDFRERIRILKPGKSGRTQYAKCATTQYDFEGLISKRQLSGLVKRLKPAIQSYNRASKYGPLSFFEVYTALAFMHFMKNKVDFAVLETGLGGRLDATNTTDPLVCALTPISYEHTQKLGNTLREIATEKAGIIKVRSTEYRLESTMHKVQSPIIISAPQEKEAMEVIRKKCREKKAKLYEVGKDILYRETKKGAAIKGLCASYSALKIPLIGKHQLINAAVAVAAVEALRFKGVSVTKKPIIEGLRKTLWPGRCEIVSRNPLIVLDGAQNNASAQALKQTIQANFRYNKLILVFGVSKDKDIEGLTQELRDLADMVILTKADNPRAAEPKDLIKYFPFKEVILTRSVTQSKEYALRLAEKGNMILVTGSLFILGEFRA